MVAAYAYQDVHVCNGFPQRHRELVTGCNIVTCHSTASPSETHFLPNIIFSFVSGGVTLRSDADSTGVYA